MKLNDFDYDLPEELIAQEPTERRDAARMLTVRRSSHGLIDGSFADFPTRLRENDLLVLNNTRVFPARLKGVSDTGARVEIFLVEQVSDCEWRALARPARRLKAGKRITFGEQLSGSIIENREDGQVVIRFEFDGNFQAILDKVGQTPLPPYIKRGTGDIDRDRDRYQTVYAKTAGAIAAPTAGLHFTDQVLDALKARGIEIAEITLHVGYGTFEPVRVSDISQHAVMSERYEISEAVADALNTARRQNRRIVAVGTTSTRALESGLSRGDEFESGEALADLTITPGYRFKAVNAMLTNFHLPQSSLLILVSTFGGHELIMEAYRQAVALRYRFYSYGDCMFIE